MNGLNVGGTAELLDEPLERENVAVAAKTRDFSDARGGHARSTTEGLAGLGIREVNLDTRHASGTERVVNRDGRVGVGSRVQEEAVGTTRQGADPIAESAFVIGLAGVYRDAERGPAYGQPLMDFIKSFVAIDLRLADAKEVQIRT